MAEFRVPVLPGSAYQVIVADPPWRYKSVRTGGSMSSGAASKYETMSQEELFAMRPWLDSIRAKDSCCFLWATVPLLPEAFALLKAWGYSYKTTLFWNKERKKLGLGSWWRGEVEPILFGIRGRVRAFRQARPNVIKAPVRAHSEKPDEVYAHIRAGISHLTPRLDLFGAGRAREGFDAA